MPEQRLPEEILASALHGSDVEIEWISFLRERDFDLGKRVVAEINRAMKLKGGSTRIVFLTDRHLVFEQPIAEFDLRGTADLLAASQTQQAREREH